MNTDDVQRGDYVFYEVYLNLDGATGMMQGAGYLDKIEDDAFIVLDGDRVIRVPFDKGTVTLRAKQHRLEV